MSEITDKLLEMHLNLATVLQDLADPGTSVDTGIGGGECEYFVTRGGIEFRVKLQPYWNEATDEPISEDSAA